MVATIILAKAVILLALLDSLELSSPDSFWVGALLVAGLGVILTVGAIVEEDTMQYCSSQFSPLYPTLQTQPPFTQPPFPLHTAPVYTLRNLLAGDALLSPLKLILHELERTFLAGEALLSPDKLASGVPQIGNPTDGASEV